MKNLKNINGLRSTRKLILPATRGVTKICLVFGLLLGFLQIVDAATFPVTTTADDGAGSLRQAIIDANADSTLDTITFNIPAGQTISPLTQLPTITQPVIIDGYTQTGASVNTLAIGDNANLQVALDGGAMGSTAVYGLRISASNCTVRGLIITRFQDAGIRIDGGTGSSIVGNFIGTNLSSAFGLGNVNRGVLIVGSSGNLLGDGTAAGRNVISGNFGSGISIASATVGSTTSNGSATIVGNYIGTDKNGTTALRNTLEGIRIVNASNSIIGAPDGAGGGADLRRNVISGNNSHGIFISQDFGTTATNNLVQGNYIGVDANGGGQTTIGGFQTSSVGNSGSGIVVQASGNIIGNTSNFRNVISGNRANGISISTNFGTSNTVVGNFIGTAADGTTVIANRDNGIQISNLAAGNTIGRATVTSAPSFPCTGACNLIANNGAPDASSAKAGVYVDATASVGNAIRGNSIFNNAGLGIDLGAVGATANDTNDPDTGANDLQNSPALSAADTNGVVAATLNSTPNTKFAVDFYRNAAPDTAATSEARTFIGTIAVTTNSGGNANVNFNSGTMILTAGQFLTATATSIEGATAQAIGDTSEISNAQVVTTATGDSPGFEADVSPRANGTSNGGDGVVGSTDVSVIQGFQLGFGLPYQGNEFQRADCAPFDTRGDGQITSLDVAQAQGYQLGFNNPPQPAAGPTAPTGGGGTMAPEFGAVENFGKFDRGGEPDGVQAGRQVRVVNQTVAAGQTVTVPINVDALGDESVYGFSISYDATKLSNPVVTRGSTDIPIPVTNRTTAGQIGVSINFGGGTITARTDQPLLFVQFTVAAGAAAGATPIAFTDTPTVRQVASAPDPDPTKPVMALPTTFTDGSVTITAAPTAAQASIGGRVSNAGGGLAGAVVTLVDGASGRSYRVRTGADGTYWFAAQTVGGEYVIAVSAAGYTFEPAVRTISLTEERGDIDFAARREKARVKAAIR